MLSGTDMRCPIQNLLKHILVVKSVNWFLSSKFKSKISLMPTTFCFILWNPFLNHSVLWTKPFVNSFPAVEFSVFTFCKWSIAPLRITLAKSNIHLDLCHHSKYCLKSKISCISRNTSGVCVISHSITCVS